MMLSEICANIKNYFTWEGDKHIGDFAIIDGAITPPLDFPTDYIRIVGSRLNDGVHRVSDDDLVNEGTFHGAVWVMSPPADFLALASEIEAWQAKNGGVNSPAMSPFNSESFGGYSYTKSSGSSGTGSSSVGASWQDAFASRLNMYRRIRV